MGQSRKDINLIIAELEAYLNDPDILFERYQLSPTEIESRNDIPKVRLAMYEQSDTSTDFVNAFKPSETLVTYNIDISVLRAYREDDAEFAELEMLDIRDALIDFGYNFSPAGLTDCSLFTFSYTGTGNYVRLQKFVTLTMNFDARKNLLESQQNPI